MSPDEIRAVLATFPHQFDVSEDEDGVPRLAFNHAPEGMCIHDVNLSSCGRFIVPPAQYGLSPAQEIAFVELGAQITKWADSAVNGLANQVQAMIGVTTGDRAGNFFSDDKAEHALRRLALEYLVAELEDARAAHRHQPADAGGPTDAAAPSAGG